MLIQAKNIVTLCGAVVAKANDLNVAHILLQSATRIEAKFKQAFELFANCHKVYVNTGLLNHQKYSNLLS